MRSWGSWRDPLPCSDSLRRAVACVAMAAGNGRLCAFAKIS